MLPNELDGSGGLARIATLQRQIQSESDNLIFVLAGDTISPSLESASFKGQQMIDLWNNLGLNIAVFGNHESISSLTYCVSALKSHILPGWRQT